MGFVVTGGFKDHTHCSYSAMDVTVRLFQKVPKAMTVMHNTRTLETAQLNGMQSILTTMTCQKVCCEKNYITPLEQGFC